MSEKATLTPRQYQLLCLVRDGRLANGYAPSGEEIADVMGISVQGVFCKVKALMEKRFLTRIVGVHRSTQLTPAAVEALCLYELATPQNTAPALAQGT